MAVTNDKEFRAWLEGQPREVCVAIAFRAAMRVLPLTTRVNAFEGAERLTLVTYRAILTSGGAAVGPTPDVRDAARAAGDAARAAGDAASAAGDAASAAAYADTALPLDQMMAQAITLPPELEAVIGPVRDAADNGLTLGKSQNSPWAFWARWYAAAMAGEPLPWELQEKVALIPNEIWEAGPEAVAEEIARIEAEFVLRERIADFEADHALLEKGRLGIGGNNPPEEIDDPKARAQVVVLWESIAGLKAEVEAEEPNADRVATLINSLSGALKAILVWCARKGDLGIYTMIKWGIPAAGGGYFIVNPAKAEAVLKTAQAWIRFLAP